jgi:hypothetical protein
VWTQACTGAHAHEHHSADASSCAAHSDEFFPFLPHHVPYNASSTDPFVFRYYNKHEARPRARRKPARKCAKALGSAHALLAPLRRARVSALRSPAARAVARRRGHGVAHAQRARTRPHAAARAQS